MNTTDNHIHDSHEGFIDGPRGPGRLGRTTLAVAAALALALSGCDDDPAQPQARGEVSVDRTTVAFDAADPVLGSTEMPAVTISNDGDGMLTVQEVAIEGSDPAAFSVQGADDAPFTIAPGGVRELTMAFDPSTEGSFSAAVRIETDAPDMSTAQVALSGMGTTFTYAQVDRMGIPALNTVFNHPSGIAGFDKTAYNVASPSDDVSNYRDAFIVVLDAVGNPDSEATADLLLPDELPIDMGAAGTAFGDLTGRAPEDDATDVALMVTVGVPSLQSDNVDSNDKAFPNEFPFFATPH